MISLGAASTTARDEGDHWVLNGTKVRYLQHFLKGHVFPASYVRTRVSSKVADPHFCLAGPHTDPEGQNAEFLHKNLRNSFFFRSQFAILYRHKSFCLSRKLFF